jgi:hypothetical protein
MKQYVVYEVSEILDMFNIEEISKLLDKQINIDNESEFLSNTTDYFKPLYYKYKCIMEAEDNSEEIKEFAKERFMTICQIFLVKICNKYGISIDDVWKDDHYEDIPGFTMGFYSFFILDLSSNIYDVCLNYIKCNLTYIYETFEDRKNKKDASTLVNKKSMSPELAIVVSNIYDVTTWILGQLSEEQFMEYMNQDYLPLGLIRGLFEEGKLVGEFMYELNNIYSSQYELKSTICFNIITNIRTGKIEI